MKVMNGMKRWMRLCGIYSTEADWRIVLYGKRVYTILLMLETLVPTVNKHKSPGAN